MEIRKVDRKKVTKTQDTEALQHPINTQDKESESDESSLHGLDKEAHMDNEEMEENNSNNASMQDDEDSRKEEDSVSTAEKDCTLHLPKATYLDAVL